METSTKFITIGATNPVDSPGRVDVIVVGAGISGLSAAKWLQEWGVGNVLVLEARNRVGGRTFTKKDSKIQYVDLGGAYVGPSQNHLLRMVKDLGIQMYKIYASGKDIFFSETDGRFLHNEEDLPKFWNPMKSMDINYCFRVIDELGKEIPADCPWKAPHAEEWDQMTVREFGERYLSTKVCRETLEVVCSTYVTSEAYEASLLWFLWYIKQCGGTKRSFNVSNGGQERKFVGGSQQISEKIAALLGDKVLLNQPVVEIDQTGQNVSVSTLDGNVYEANYVILAIPPMLQMKIHFIPSLPVLRNQMIQRVPMGSVIKIMIYYKTYFWRNKGLSGTSLILGGDDYPVSFTLDDTKPDGTLPAIIGFICGDKARKLSMRSVEERKLMIAKSLAVVFDSPEALDPIHYEEHNWMTEQYSGGCYTAMYPPGCFTRYGPVLREPFEKIYYAGTETSTVWSGYMEGAISAGERAAREVLHKMGKISKSQIWREEPESKEVPAVPFPMRFWEQHMPSAKCAYRFLKLSIILATLGTATAYIHFKHLKLTK